MRAAREMGTTMTMGIMRAGRVEGDSEGVAGRRWRQGSGIATSREGDDDDDTTSLGWVGSVGESQVDRIGLGWIGFGLSYDFLVVDGDGVV